MGFLHSGGAPLLALGMSSYIGFMAFQSPSLFSWHPLCMSLGFGFFLPLGILLAKQTREVKQRRDNHAYCQWMFVICALAGFYAIYQNKDNHGYPHFTSWHSWYGAAAVTLCLGVSFGGSAAYTAWMYKLMKPKTIQTYIGYHKLGGTSAAFFALVALASGYYSGWGANNLGVGQEVFTALTCVVFGLAFTAKVKSK